MNKNSNQSGYIVYPPVTREMIETKKKSNDVLPILFLSKAVTHEAKIACNFSNAEWVFNEIMLDYNARGNHFTEKEEQSLVRAITTMVRYAPTPPKAMRYATLFFKDYSERLRTPSRELIVLTNLIFAHTNHQTQENMEVALNILKLALEIGVYKIDRSHYQDYDNRNFSDPLEVFSTVSKRVLFYFKLALSQDKSELVPFVRFATPSDV